MRNEVFIELKTHIKKTINYFESQLQTVRAGRANTAILDQIVVEYYGVQTPLNQMASLSAPEPRLITITPFDKTVIPDIEKAILVANIGLNPSNDGKIIRLAIPMLTEENRINLTKIVRTYLEDTKIALRNLRRNANSSLQELEKDGDIREDDLIRDEKEVQTLIDEATKKSDEISENKISEIMEV